MIRINNREYSYGDIRVLIFGQEIQGIRGIEYKAKKAKEAFYGAGNTARGIQHKRREYEGTITILQSDLQALNRSAKLSGYKDILDVDFDILFCYLSDDGILTTDRVICASISELPFGMKEGDSLSEHALPFVAIDMEFSIV